MIYFRYTVEEPPDKAWGILTNGSWNGMIGMLQRKVITNDSSFCIHFMTY